jgi:hypothetical protein
VLIVNSKPNQLEKEKHNLKVYMMNPGVILDRVIINLWIWKNLMVLSLRQEYLKIINQLFNLIK